MAESRTKLEGVQTLRALAALAVVVFHASWRANPFGDGWTIGQAGVDVFFVVSGFIMWVVRSRGGTPLHFALDRVLRIVPLYWVATTAMVVGAVLHLFPNLILSWTHVAASYAFLPYPSANTGALQPILVQGWTLNYEMFFYLVFALVLCAPRPSHLPLLCGFMVLLTGAGAALQPDDIALRFYSNPIILEFAAGACIGACWTNGIAARPAIAWAALAVGLALFVAQSFAPWELERVLKWGGPAALIVMGVTSLEKAGVSLSTRGTLFLGNASYSIYLFHTFGTSLGHRIAGGAVPVWLEAILLTAVGAAVGIAAYLLVEKPFMYLAKQWRRPRARATGTVAADSAS